MNELLQKCPYTDKNCVHSLPICKAYEKEYKPLTAIRCKIEVGNKENKIHQTNSDRIRSMSDEELAEFLPIVSDFMCKPTDKCMENIFNHGECEKRKECALKWLQSEVEE